MSLKRVFCCVISFVFVVAVCGESFAQFPGQRRPLCRAGKVLGLGWSSGNHWRNPMVNPDYYNPYTAHNSQLSSQGAVWGSDNTIFTPASAAEIPINALPGEKVEAAVETHPAASPQNEPAEKNKSDQDPKNGSDSGLSNFINSFDLENSELFERPVMAEPEYRPTVENQIPQKIRDINEDNFWQEK